MEEMNNSAVSAGTPKKFNLHKVFAAIGIILTVAIIILAAVWYYLEKQSPNDSEDTSVKVTTSSAKPATKSASPSAE